MGFWNCLAKVCCCQPQQETFMIYPRQTTRRVKRQHHSLDMFAHTMNFIPADQDPNNLPITYTYTPRSGSMIWGPGSGPVPLPYHQQMPYNGNVEMMPMYNQSYPYPGVPYPGVPPMPGAYPQQYYLPPAPPPPGPLPYGAPNMGPVPMCNMPFGATMQFLPPPGMPFGGAGLHGGGPYPNHMSNEAMWGGKTIEEVANDNLNGACASGANKPNAEIMPLDPAEDDMFWVVELDGTRNLRSYMSVTLSCYPGRWHQDAYGVLYFVRHQAQETA